MHFYVYIFYFSALFMYFLMQNSKKTHYITIKTEFHYTNFNKNTYYFGHDIHAQLFCNINQIQIVCSFKMFLIYAG